MVSDRPPHSVQCVPDKCCTDVHLPHHYHLLENDSMQQEGNSLPESHEFPSCHQIILMQIFLFQDCRNLSYHFSPKEQEDRINHCSFPMRFYLASLVLNCTYSNIKLLICCLILTPCSLLWFQSQVHLLTYIENNIKHYSQK